MKNLFCIFLFFGFTVKSNLVFATKVKTGYWHTEFQLAKGINLPVDFSLVKTKKKLQLIIENGAEEICLDQILFSGDSIFIPFKTFDAELRMKIHSKTYLTGVWLNHAKSANYFVPFWAKYENKARYPFVSKQLPVAGKWEVTFDYKTNPEKAVGLFEYQTNTLILSNILYGTFLTETGDYRYLEGATIGDSLYLSTFDGSHAFLFTAQLQKDTLWGTFYSGKHYKTDWFAVRNENFELTHPDSLTYVINEEPLSFSLKKLDNTTYSYPNELTKNKVVLIQIMGTWCPNCLDESNYLKTIKENYNDKIEIIAVTFETQKTEEEKIEKVKKYKDALDLNYTFLIGGDACKPCAAEIFPQLSDIISFPTLIFIDKTGAIKKIHTGFSGPGTGEYYTRFVTETNNYIDKLITE